MDQPYMGYDSPVVFNGWLYNPPKPEPDQTCPACCDCCECGIGVSEVGVRYVNGEVRLSIPVLTAGGFGRPWGHTITYTNRLPASWDLGNGFNWFVEQWPYLLKCVDEEFQTFNYIVFVQSSWTAVWFDFDEMSGDYSPRHAAHYGLTHDTANNVYKLATCEGEIWEFNDWDQTSAPGGSFKRLTTKGGTTIEVVSYTAQCRIAEMRRTYTSGGTTVVESLLYTYFTSCEQRGRLQTVTLRRQVNGGSWTEIARAEFEYYGEADGVECAGDLKRIKVQVLSGTSWQDEAVYYFRYYQMGESNGFARGLKYVVAPESYNRLVTSVGNPDNATDTQVAGFAARFIEYDANKRVKTVKVAGGARSHTFTDTASSHSNSYNNWKMKSVETRPGGSQRIVYTNYVGQAMVDEFKSGAQSWIDYFKFDGNARRIELASPSGVTGNNDSQANLGVSLRSSDGLIRVTDYYASGDGEGHVQFEKVKQGSGGTAIKLKAFEYVARTAGLASVHPVSKETVYRNSDGTGAIDTTYSYSWYTGTVQMEERVTSLPAIPTAQHGSGSADTRTERFDLYGNLTWLKNERGFLTRHTYDIPTGVRTETIEDVDTAQVSDEPTGWTTPSGGGLHLVSEFDADARGRVIETREPWHTIDLAGTATSIRSVQWSVYKDLDGEVWSAAGYATGTAPNYTYTMINPVSITRRDDAGRVTDEIQAVRASTTGKLSASDSFPQSTWVRWSTNSYSDQGDLVWSRVYHTIPASGAGSSGTNYDQTDFGIDAQGRRNKVKTPGGTITRTVFDVRGQAVKTFVGTNDTGATDSE
ncbi:MAG: hypothetical protein J5I93_26615 [Pirellulaceae bacterium]|nr:hypothetical protein [Pirellulaceae bacterium]